MNGLLTKEYEIGVRALTPNLRIKASDILDYFQEAATIHAENAGYTMEWFNEMKQGFMVLKWEVSVKRYPHWLEKIIIRTWAPEAKKILAKRCFSVLDSANVEIITASSMWVYMDIDRRRPIRPPKGMLDKFKAEVSEFVEPESEFPLAEDSKLIETNHFIVTRRDTDSNFHVNNAKYMTWAEDLIPDCVFNAKEPACIKISYQKECVKGSEILSQLFETDNGDYLCTFSDPTDVYTEYAKIFIKW